MTVRENRFSTTVQQAPWLDADAIERGLLIDFEDGPIAVADSSEGLSYQRWQMTWAPGTGDFIFTPQDVGSPVAFHNAPLVSALSFCFDQNANITLFYVTNGSPYLHWWNADGALYETTAYPNVTSGMLCLDDKRQTQTNISDMLFWYTEQQLDLTYNLYNREQRDRFENAYLFAEDVPPYVYKAGMTTGLRVQVELKYGAS